MNRTRLMRWAIVCLAAVLFTAPATAQGLRRETAQRPTVRSAVLTRFAQFEEEVEPESGAAPFDLPQRDESDSGGAPFDLPQREEGPFDEQPPTEGPRLVPDEYRTPLVEGDDRDEANADVGSQMSETDEQLPGFDDPILPWGEGPYDSAAILGDACENCGFRACVCPPRWFGEVEATYLTRQRARNIFLSNDLVNAFPVNVGGQQFLIVPRAMETSSDKFGFEPGVRAKIGRYLGSDFIHRDHTVEFEYFGLQEWGASSTVTALGQSLYPNAFFPQFDIPGFDVSPNFFVSGSLNSPFPNAVGGFNRADVHSFDYASRLHNFEINYRVRRGPERDRLVYQSDGAWEPQPGPSWRVSALAGFRALALDEDFSFRSRGRSLELSGTSPFPPISGSEFDFSGDLEIETRNRLFGFQTGGDMRMQGTRFSFGVRGKVGAYANFAQQRSSVRVTDRADLFLLPNRSGEFDDVAIALIGEVGFEARYRITPAFALRMAYDFMWVTGLALAPEQIEFSFQQEPKVNDGGAILVQGLTAGFELAW